MNIYYVEFNEDQNKRSITLDELKENPQDERTSGNCLVVFDQQVRINEGSIVFDCVSAVHFHRNSPVASSSVSVPYLQKRCKRISKKLAFEIHPELESYMAQTEV